MIRALLKISADITILNFCLRANRLEQQLNDNRLASAVIQIKKSIYWFSFSVLSAENLVGYQLCTIVEPEIYNSYLTDRWHLVFLLQE